MIARPWRSAALAIGVLVLAVPRTVEAQLSEFPGPEPEAERQGALPDASFATAFRKYTPPRNRFSPFYSWDAEMALNLTLFRKGPGAVRFRGVMQTLGTENLGSKVSVGGTGYIIDVGYVHAYSAAFALSAGVSHLSSHLTRDLDDKLEEERVGGAAIPIVDDPSEYNVPYFKVYREFQRVPLTPAIEIAVEPISFRFNAAPRAAPRPVYLATRWRLWHGRESSLAAETQHEFGKNPFNQLALVLGLYTGTGRDGRLQIFLSVSPGSSMHVSPNIGGLRDGIAFGARVRLRSSS